MGSDVGTGDSRYNSHQLKESVVISRERSIVLQNTVGEKDSATN